MNALALALACAGDPASPASDQPLAGTYTLQSINASPLPYVAEQQGTTTISIASASITLAEDATWTSRVEFLTVQGPQTWNQFGGDNGTWARSGGNLTLFSTKNNKTAYVGGFSTNRLDLAAGTVRFVFVK